MAREFKSAAEFAREIAQFDRRLKIEYQRELGLRAAKRGQKIAEQEASRDLGGDPQFSGWPAARLETRVKADATGAALMPRSRPAAAGWTTATFGRNSAAGPAQLRSGRRQRILKSGALSTARGTRRRYNGQTDGKGTAGRAIVRMEREIRDDVDRQFKRDLGRHFDVR